MGRINKIDHINIVVTDLKRTQGFFEALGFEAVGGSRLTGEWVSQVVGLEEVDAEFVQMSLHGGETMLELIRYDNPPIEFEENLSNPNKLGFRHMAFEVTGIEEIVENLKSLGIEFQSDIQIYPKNGKKLVYFQGPDGIVLELAEYPSSK